MDSKKSDKKIALALSGGGIRSATFALGVLQALAQRGKLGRIGVLSTVSGGGYIGAFLCRLAAEMQTPPPFTAEHPSPLRVPSATAWQRTEQVLLKPTSAQVTLPDGKSVFHPLQWLRENSRYLTPSGSDDLVNGLAYYLRGLLGLHFHLALMLLLVGLLNVGLGLAGDWLWAQARSAHGVEAATVRQWLAQPSANPVAQCVAHTTLAPEGEPCRWMVPSGWWAVLAIALLVTVANGVAYWLSARPNRAPAAGSVVDWREKREAAMSWVAGFALVGMFGAWSWQAYGIAPQQFIVALGSLIICLMAGGIFFVSFAAASLKTAGQPQLTRFEAAQVRTDVQRRYLTVRLTRWLKLAAGVAVIALIDTAAMSLVQYRAMHGSWFPWSLPVALYGAVLAAAWKWLMQTEPADSKPSRFAGLAQLALLCLALAVLAGLALIYQMVAYEMALSGPSPNDLHLSNSFDVAGQTGVVAACALLVAICVQYTPGFLNLSSFHNLYTARLKRAYLGAANPQRLSPLADEATPERDRRKAFVNEVIAGDEPVSIENYIEDNRNLGIEHVINVTLNQRISSTSPTLAQDRQGVPACLTGHGLWAHPAQRTGENHGFDWKSLEKSRLSLGQWLSISGAAFSVGVGKETKPGYALLAFLANVRTAYWWRRPDTEAETKAKALAQRERNKPARLLKKGVKRIWEQGTWGYLLEEARCRFVGIPGRYWYLSDGGHFDNTGVYELLRREERIVLASDNGADPDYLFDDLMHLLRRVRIDFGAEAVVRSSADIQAWHWGLNGFGTPQEFRQSRLARTAMPCALWVEVYYDRGSKQPRDLVNGRPDTVVVFVKPSLPEGLPGDVCHYAQTHPTFPQETTADQFFDEAQWESYRALGQNLMTRVLTPNLFEAIDERLAPEATSGP